MVNKQNMISVLFKKKKVLKILSYILKLSKYFNLQNIYLQNGIIHIVKQSVNRHVKQTHVILFT